MTSMQIPTLPPHQMREVPGGYTISAETIDAIEAIHQVWMVSKTKGFTPTQKKTGKLDPGSREAEVIRGHLTQRNRVTHDNLTRDGITRRLQFCMAAGKIGAELPKITEIAIRRKAERAAAREAVRQKLMRRSYGKILQVAVLTALRSAQRDTNGYRHRPRTGDLDKSAAAGRKILSQGTDRYRSLFEGRSNQGTALGKLLRWEAVQKYRKKMYQGRFGAWEARKKSRWKRPDRRYQERLRDIQGTGRLHVLAPWLVPPWR